MALRLPADFDEYRLAPPEPVPAPTIPSGPFRRDLLHAYEVTEAVFRAMRDDPEWSASDVCSMVGDIAAGFDSLLYP